MAKVRRPRRPATEAIMTNSPKTIRKKAAVLALVALTSAALPMAPALADGRHGHRPQGWGWDGGRGYDRGYDRGGWRGHGGYDRHRDRDDGAAIAVAAGVGLLLGAALMSQPQPSYYTPPPSTVYAPPPASYYGQAPIEAYPASDVYRTDSGQYCREYQSTINVGGRFQQGYGTACLGEDGAWRVVN